MITRTEIHSLQHQGFIHLAEETSKNILGQKPISWQLGIKGKNYYNKKILYLKTDNFTQQDEWSPLPLERETQASKDAIQSVETLLERVRGDNGFAVSEPEKHKSIVCSLETGLNALKNTLPTKEQLRALVVAPIKWLGARFVRAEIAELANQALQALQHWLGPFF
jgi:hypothetical protein